MFDLGFQELVVIFVVALLVFGPKRLPELAKTMGKTMGHLKKTIFDLKTEIDREINVENPISKQIDALKNLESYDERPRTNPSEEVRPGGPQGPGDVRSKASYRPETAAPTVSPGSWRRVDATTPVETASPVPADQRPEPSDEMPDIEEPSTTAATKEKNSDND